jgi:hypothetical protein
MLKITIQHHPKRNRYLELLLNSLHTELESQTEFEIVSNDINSADGMLEVFGRIGRADHLLVFQDDVLPCKDIVATAERLIELRPKSFISLFSAYQVTEEALRERKHWASIDRAYGLCGYIIPREMVLGYIDFEPRINHQIKADDVKLSVFLGHINEPIYLTAPSLVEHICWDRSTQQAAKVSMDSIKYRLAWKYLGYEESGMEVDWTQGLDNPTHLQIGTNYDLVRHIKE